MGVGALVQGNNQVATNAFRPFVKSGRTAQRQLMAQMGLSGGEAFDVTQTPGYQQSLEQAIGAVNQGAAGSGMLNSGERLKSLGDAGQSVFGDYYNNYMNRLQGISGQGMSATGNLQNIRSNNLNALIGYEGGGQGAQGAMQGDMMGAAASMFGSWMGGGKKS